MCWQIFVTYAFGTDDPWATDHPRDASFCIQRQRVLSPSGIGSVQLSQPCLNAPPPPHATRPRRADRLPIRARAGRRAGGGLPGPLRQCVVPIPVLAWHLPPFFVFFTGSTDRANAPVCVCGFGWVGEMCVLCGGAGVGGVGRGVVLWRVGRLKFLIKMIKFLGKISHHFFNHQISSGLCLMQCQRY